MALLARSITPVDPGEIKRLGEQLARLKESPDGDKTVVKQLNARAKELPRLERQQKKTREQVRRALDRHTNMRADVLVGSVSDDQQDTLLVHSLPLLINAMGGDVGEGLRTYEESLAGVDRACRLGFTEAMAHAIEFDRRVDGGPTKPSMRHLVETTAKCHSASQGIVPQGYGKVWANRILPEACRPHPPSTRPMVVMNQHDWTLAATSFTNLMGEVEDLPDELKEGFASEVVPALIRSGLIDKAGRFAGHGRGSTSLKGHQKAYCEVAELLKTAGGEWPNTQVLQEFPHNLAAFIDEGGFQREDRGGDYQWESMHELLSRLPQNERVNAMGGSLCELARTGVFRTRMGWERVNHALGLVGDVRLRDKTLREMTLRIRGGDLSDQKSWSG